MLILRFGRGDVMVSGNNGGNAIFVTGSEQARDNEGDEEHRSATAKLKFLT